MRVLNKKIIIILEAVSEYYFNSLYMISSLNEIGVDYEIWVYCNEKEKLSDSDKYRISDQNILSINEVETRLCREEECIVITSVCCGVSRSNIALFKLLSKLKIRYGAFCHVPYVELNIRNGEKDYVGAVHYGLSPKNILYDLLRIRDINGLVRLICNIKGQLPFLFGIRNMDLIIVSGTKSEELYLHFPCGANTKRIWAHCNDTEIYIKDDTELSENICTFIDTNLFWAIDASEEIKEYMMDTAEIYGKEICAFFDSVERITGLDVEIACHPRLDRTQIDFLRRIYGWRRVKKGETLQMIKQSKYVFVTMSSAIKYSVLSHKKTFVLSTSSLKKEKNVNSAIRQMAKLLETDVIDVDRIRIDDKDSYDNELRSLFLRQKDCGEFEKRYCRVNPNDNRVFWDIVINELNSLVI